MVKIIFEDNHLLVVIKPAGVPTQPDFQKEMQQYLKKKYHKKGNVFLYPIHRLDKPVSGLVLFAKTSKALRRLHEAQRRREIVKIYRAEVEGILQQEEGTLEHYLTHESFYAKVAKEGKLSRLFYRVLQRKKDATLIEIILLTGRYHQIRAQFSAIGHPIVGDTKYGSKRGNSLCLSHVKMECIHPVTKRKLCFENLVFGTVSSSHLDENCI